MWDDLRPGVVVHLLTEVALVTAAAAGAFLSEHVGAPLAKGAEATGAMWNEKVAHPIAESPTFKAVSAATSLATVSVGNFFSEKARARGARGAGEGDAPPFFPSTPHAALRRGSQVVHPIAESDAYKSLAEKSAAAWEATKEGAGSLSSYMAEKASAAAAAAGEYAHKAKDAMAPKPETEVRRPALPRLRACHGLALPQPRLPPAPRVSAGGEEEARGARGGGAAQEGGGGEEEGREEVSIIAVTASAQQPRLQCGAQSHVHDDACNS